MSDLHSRIQRRITHFLGELGGFLRRESLATLSATLGHAARAPAPQAARPRRAAHSVAPTARAKTARSRKSGEKRAPEQLARTVEALVSYIASNRGHGMQQMVEGMRMPKADLQLPIAKLLAEKRIRKTGVKRGTKYYAAK